MEWSPMGKRIASGTAAEEELSFGAGLASLRKAAGFTQIELAAELGLPVIDAFIERGQLERKAESRA